MSQSGQAAAEDRKKSNLYKWIAGVAVPIGVAIIGILKFGGHDTSSVTSATFVSDVTVIENQYQKITGKPLSDQDLREKIQKAINLEKAGEREASRQILEEVVVNVPVPAIYNDLGVLYVERGDVKSAGDAYKHALEQDPEYAPALQNEKRLGPGTISVRDRESEPNNDFDHANVIPVGQEIAAEIASSADVDFYKFTTSNGPRDHYQALFKNQSESLHPYLIPYDGNRHQLINPCYSQEALAQLPCTFSAQPQSNYYVQIAGTDGTAGRYKLIVTPLKLYDRYEPNDDFPQATPIDLGSVIEANIMDGQDTDYYIVKTGSTAAELTALFVNGSTTLHPWLAVYDGNRHQLINPCYSQEALTQLPCTFSAQAQSSYYVEIAGADGTAGSYKLVVK